MRSTQSHETFDSPWWLFRALAPPLADTSRWRWLMITGHSRGLARGSECIKTHTRLCKILRRKEIGANPLKTRGFWSSRFSAPPLRRLTRKKKSALQKAFGHRRARMSGRFAASPRRHRVSWQAAGTRERGERKMRPPKGVPWLSLAGILAAALILTLYRESALPCTLSLFVLARCKEEGRGEAVAGRGGGMGGGMRKGRRENQTAGKALPSQKSVLRF